MNTLSPWRVKEFGEQLAYLVPDAEFRTNAGKMSCVGTITTETVDMDRDIIRTKGINLSQHRRNPVVLLAHNREAACGKAEDPMGRYTVKMIGDNRMEAETFFAKGTRLGEEAFRLVEDKILRGHSIGFPRASAVVAKGYDPAGQQVQVYESCELFEYSILPLPSNLDCLIERVEKGYGRTGKLCPELDAMLRPFIPERSESITSGWESKGFIESDHPRAHGRFASAGKTAESHKSHVQPPRQKMYDDDTLNGAQHDDAMPEDTTGPMDGLEDETEDDMAEMKPGAQLAHAGHDLLVDAIGFFNEAAEKIDNPTMQKATEKAVAGLQKIIANWQSAYSSYAGEHGTPALPGAPEVAPGEPGEELDSADEEPTDDETPADDESDTDDNAADESDDSTGSTPEKDEKKKKEEKSIQRAVLIAKAWWAQHKANMRRELAGEHLARVERIEKALAALDTAGDMKKVARVCKGIKAEFAKVKLTKPVASVAIDPIEFDADAILAAVESHLMPLGGRLAALEAN